MDWESATLLFLTLIISLTFHEASHALFGLLGGDRTAHDAGQVTLNPLAHIRREPFGMVALPLLMLLSSQGRATIGYAHAPYDPRWAERHPRRAALMSLAGPLANVFLAAVAFGVLYGIARPDSDNERHVRTIATQFLSLNLLLAVFNLVPLPPLDGAGIVQGLFPATRQLFDRIRANQFVGIALFIVLSLNLHRVVWPIYYVIDGWLPYPTRY